MHGISGLQSALNRLRCGLHSEDPVQLSCPGIHFLGYSQNIGLLQETISSSPMTHYPFSNISRGHRFLIIFVESFTIPVVLKM